jgi:ATP-dependent helicase/DNAse subunit B
MLGIGERPGGQVALSIIAGPPNSGRAGIIRQRFTAEPDRDPVLVLPTLDDVFAFERELTTASGALLGGTITTFNGLFEQVARSGGEVPPPRLSDAQRLRLAAIAVRRSAPRILARSARRPGFAAAALRLIDELQAAGLDPGSVSDGARGLEESAYLDELAALYAAYLELRDGSGRGDTHLVASLALAAVRGDPRSWGRRPVFLYGFDDLTAEQLEMVGVLAAAAEVTVAMTYENRAALAARGTLLAELRRVGADAGLDEETTAAHPGHTESALLFALERGFGEPDAARAQADGSLVLLRSAGERGEAEAVAGEISRLLAAGAEPGRIVVAMRDPAGRGPLLGRILEAAGVPVAIEGDLPITATATGDSLLALLRAALGGGTAADLLRHLRGPRRASPSSVDWLERTIMRRRLRSADEAIAAWAESNQDGMRDLETLRAVSGEPEALLHLVAELARDIAEWPLARDETRGKVPGAGPALELRAGNQIAVAAEELAELEGAGPGPEELIGIVEGLTLPLWRGPAENRVRIASPYRLRAGRFDHVFVTSLQDGEFPRHDAGSPFLTDQQRAAIGLRARAETEAEERYLFYSCVSLPTRSLTLSWRDSDESGAAEQPSPLLDDVRTLLDPPPPEGPGEPDELAEALTRGRGLGAIVFAPADAPSEDDLARSLAVRRSGGDGRSESHLAELSALEVEPALAARVAARLESAFAAEERTRAPGPLRQPAVIAALSARREYGGTTLEGVATCSYRWFVDHELDPEPLGPRPEPLVQGGIVHRALERLYRERPGGEPLPRPHSLALWTGRASELVAEAAAEARLSPTHPADRAIRRRVERLLAAFLRREATRPAVLEPALLEAGFGSGPDDDRPSLDLGGWLLHGRIDRVDTGAGAALLHDYKMAREVKGYRKFADEGLLQLPLYMLALRSLWGLDLAGGLYQPLRATSDPRGRGLARASECEGALLGIGLVRTDVVDDDDFEAALEQTRRWAGELVARTRAGTIERNPIGGQCPKFCTFAPICRRERGVIAEPDPELGEEEG